ncbi:hypothetical protein R1T44_12335 [Cobetia amphilecti]|uniref:hypothetical protein n=1 Tax=Cobetia amphilecti TaxID=1055104 RepID=UPI002941C8D0|nr:hypothetical protein [Cobetia amphilecti]WOI24923.1 hypothetical protein R1T44_12335 [Cobetia amphilecti]|tara:strand:- start:9458 stop:10651 length:1194 start_codon:yes stop_codon:yes gene_type:complete
MSSSFRSNMKILVINKGIEVVFPLIFIPLLITGYSLDAYGEYFLAQTIVAFLVIIVELGAAPLLLKRALSHRGALLVANLFIVKLIIFIIVAIGIAMSVRYGFSSSMLAYMMLFLAAELFNYNIWYATNGYGNTVIKIQVIIKSIVLLVILFSIFKGIAIEIIALMHGALLFLPNLCLILYRRKDFQRVTIRAYVIKTILQNSYNVVSYRIISASLMPILGILINQNLGAATLGKFGILQRISSLIMKVCEPVVLAFIKEKSKTLLLKEKVKDIIVKHNLIAAFLVLTLCCIFILEVSSAIIEYNLENIQLIFLAILMGGVAVSNYYCCQSAIAIRKNTSLKYVVSISAAITIVTMLLFFEYVSDRYLSLPVFIIAYLAPLSSITISYRFIFGRMLK